MIVHTNDYAAVISVTFRNYN